MSAIPSCMESRKRSATFPIPTPNVSGAHGETNGHHETKPKTPFLIGVAGGTASGKSTVCRKIMEKLGQDTVDNRHQQVVCISQDSFYRELNEEERKAAFKGNYDFDHPDALDNELMIQCLMDVLHGKEVSLPVYDFKTHARKTDEYTRVYPADVVLFEGILVFYFPEVRDLFHMKLFVDTDPDTRLARRVIRDVQERGRDLDLVLNVYTSFVKPAFEDFCMPTKKYADVIIPRGADNEVAIDLIVQTISDFLANNKHMITINRPKSPGTPGASSRSRYFSGSLSSYGTSPCSPTPGRPH